MFQQPESPITEDWAWQTDTMRSDNATEQRVATSPYPKRNFNMQFVFTEKSDLLREQALMVAFGGPFQVPLWQHQTRLKTDAASGAAALVFVAARTELRDGCKAYVFDRDGGEIVTINAVTSTGASLTGVTTRAYSKRASICPVSAVIVGTNASMMRGNADNYGSMTLSLQETGFLIPFANVFNTAALTMFNGLPVLERNSIGKEFVQSIDTGIKITDYGGVVDIRSPWLHPQFVYPRTFRCPKLFDASDWGYWRAFADYAKGSQNPFYLPTFRDDFGLALAPAPGGTSLHFTGTAYADTFFPMAPFKAIAIFTAAGVHYATVSAAVSSGGNSNVTFAPALPAGADWGTVEKVSLLLKVRIADDKISCKHENTYTDLTMSLRTVDA